MFLPTSSRKTQWMLIGAGYAAITAFATSAFYVRHLNELRDPQLASSGMNAAGDALLIFFLTALYLVPTSFSLKLFSDNVRLFEVFSRVLLGLSLTAPLALIVACIVREANNVKEWALLRIFVAPVMICVMGVSRWVARSSPAKRSLVYGLAVEGTTLIVAVALLFLA